MILARVRWTLKTLPRWLVIVIVLVILLVLAGGFWFLYFQNQAMQREVARDLTAIAQLKIDQITSWRADQINDAELLAPLAAPLASRYLASSDLENEQALRILLQNLAAQHDYADILLFDHQGEARWRLAASGDYYRKYLPAVETALQTGEVVFLDLHRQGENADAHISVVAPLSGASEPIGALVLISNADQFLYPLIQSWPIPSESAETLLVRQEGDQVLFLNELRRQPGAALDLRFPLSQTDLPAVMAVQGVEGFVRGRDYRGAPVAAVLLPVPDSPWFIVSKVDVDEAFSEGRFRSAVILAFMLGFVGLSVAGSVAVQQRMEKLRYLDLHQSQARQKALLESIYRNAPLVLMVVDGERRIRQVNGFAAQFAGRAAEEMLGLRGGEALRCLHALDAPEGCGFGEFCQECIVRNTVLDTLANRSTHLQVEATLPFLIDGQEEQLTFLLSSTPLGPPEENLALVTMLEITERVQAKRESQRLLAQQRAINQLTLSLGEQQNLTSIYRKIYQFSQELIDPQVFFVTSIDHQAQSVRAQFFVNRGEEMGVSHNPPIPFEQLDDPIWRTVIARGEPVYLPDMDREAATPKQGSVRRAKNSGQNREITKLFEQRWDPSNQSTIFVPMQVQGEMIGIIQVLSDQPDAYSPADIAFLNGIANVGAIAVQIALLIGQLEDTVADRTAELEQKVARLTMSEEAMLYMVEDLNQITAELTQERRKLALSNQELEAFAYSVSHDLRAPLRAINGFASFLKQDYAESLDDDGKRFIDVIQGSATKMDRLISDLLNLSRISRAELARVRVDMAEVARLVCREILPEAEKAAFEIEIKPMPPAFCDPTLIKQVWKNLIENAYKYSLNASVKQITIGSQEGDGELQYWVRDRGEGFDPQYQHKLFGVFQRLHSQEQYEGTGVGLAIVKRIIERHRGRVWAEGEPGQGATFYFSLPNHFE